MKKVLITGFLGQIGSELTRQCLDRGWFVIGADNQSQGIPDNLGIEYLQHTNLAVVNDIKDIPLIRFDYIFHCAALANIADSLKNPYKYFFENVAITQFVVDLAHKLGSKIIYCASSSCYGDTPELPTKENAEINCKYPYSLTKYMAEELVIHYGKVFKVPFVSFRIFNVYSPYIKGGSGYGSVIKVFARSYLEIIANKTPLLVIGDGKQRRDFLHVKDCVRALIMGAESPLDNEIFNLGNGNPQEINYLIELMFGRNYPRDTVPARKGEPITTWADITKVNQLLGWSPRITFEDGIKEVMKNIENYRGFPYFDKKKYYETHNEWHIYLGQEL